MITQEQLRKLLAYNPDTGDFTRISDRQQFKTGEIAGTLNKDGYIVIEINEKAYFASRLAWFYMTNEWPKNEIDHINTIKNDNRWINLREATHTKNLHNINVRKDNMLGIKGIRVKGMGFEVRIVVNGKSKYLGIYYSMKDAKQAYDDAAKKYFGEFARS